MGVHTQFADAGRHPGVHAVITPGHSSGHTSYVISTTVGRLIAFGDAFHIPAQLAQPGWPSKPDVDGAAVLAARKRLVADLTEPDTLGFVFHFGDQAFGQVSGTSRGCPGGNRTGGRPAAPRPACGLHPTAPTGPSSELLAFRGTHYSIWGGVS